MDGFFRFCFSVECESYAGLVSRPSLCTLLAHDNMAHLPATPSSVKNTESVPGFCPFYLCLSRISNGAYRCSTIKTRVGTVLEIACASSGEVTPFTCSVNLDPGNIDIVPCFFLLLLYVLRIRNATRRWSTRKVKFLPMVEKPTVLSPSE